MKFRYALAAVLGVVTPLSIMAGIQWYSAAALAGAAKTLSGYSHWDGAGTAILIVIVLLGINVAVLLLLGMGTRTAVTSARPAPTAAPFAGASGGIMPAAAPVAKPAAAEPAVPTAPAEVSVQPGDTVDSLTMRILEADRAAGVNVSMSGARRRATELLAQSNAGQMP